MPWFRQLSAEDRSWIGLIVQAGIKSFAEWYEDPRPTLPLRSEVFGAAPQALAGVVTLEHTVAMVRLSIAVVEENLAEVFDEADIDEVRDSVIRYGRELAFATAEVYARAAEQRGAWDARLEALVVDSVLRGEVDETVESRAHALGWRGSGHVVVAIGVLPDGGGSPIDGVRHLAREKRLDCLCAVQGARLVVILGGVDRTSRPVGTFADTFGPGTLVIGPVVPGLREAGVSATAASSGFRAAPGWPDAPRPVRADDLLPERALAGDQSARTQLVEDLYRPLREAGHPSHPSHVVLDTLECYLERGGSLEATARQLFIHANTVRYRLNQAHEITGLSPTLARDAYTYRMALTLGRQADATSSADL